MTWITSHQAKPPVASPYDYGWQKGSNGPTPVLFSGLMSSDFLQDLICSCKGRKICSRECELVWQDLYFAFGSYNFATTFLATHIEDSRSGSLSCERSKSSADEDLISLKTDFFSNTKDSRNGITTSQSMNRWENFTSYTRQRTTQVMNWYESLSNVQTLMS
jgi:hypothetical protein